MATRIRAISKPQLQMSTQGDSLQALLGELVGQAPSTDDQAPAGASGDVRIERLILHHLDNHADRMELVDEIAQLDERSSVFFISHILAAARRAEWFARFSEPACEAAVLCRRLISTGSAAAHDSQGIAPDDFTDDFVVASQALARRLFALMRRNLSIAPGDFVAIVYTADGRPQRHIALLKLDLDQERLIRTFEHEGGHTRVRITTAGNLLPETIKLQKCALLTVGEHASDFAITLLDYQAGPRSEGVAQFFYRDFLMATLTPSARRFTRLFLADCDTWLANVGNELTPADILRFYRARREALVGETVDVALFATLALPNHQHLQESLRNALLSRPSDVGWGSILPVDRAVADPVIQMVTLELDGKAILKMDAKLFETLVRVADQRTGENTFHIEIETLTLREVTR